MAAFYSEVPKPKGLGLSSRSRGNGTSCQGIGRTAGRLFKFGLFFEGDDFAVREWGEAHFCAQRWGDRS
jgi:hypothetical protein